MSNNFTCGPQTDGESYISLYNHTHALPTGTISGLNPSHERDEVLFADGTNAFGRWQSSISGGCAHHCLVGAGSGINSDWSLNSEVILMGGLTCGELGSTQFNVSKKAGESFARYTMNTNNTCNDQVTYCAGCINFETASCTFIPVSQGVNEVVFFAAEDCIRFRNFCIPLSYCKRDIIIK